MKLPGWLTGTSATPATAPAETWQERTNAEARNNLVAHLVANPQDIGKLRDDLPGRNEVLIEVNRRRAGGQ